MPCSQPLRVTCRALRAAGAWLLRRRCCVGIERSCGGSGGSLRDGAGGRSCPDAPYRQLMPQHNELQLLELGRARTKQDELEHAAERQIPKRQEQEQLLGISGTGARLYGQHARPRRRTEITHPSREHALECLRRCAALPVVRHGDDQPTPGDADGLSNASGETSWAQPVRPSCSSIHASASASSTPRTTWISCESSRRARL